MGMGGISPDIPTYIPKPPENLRVAIVDVQGTRTVITQFSLDATTFLSGRMGAGSISIPFRNLRRVSITKKGEKFFAEALTVAGKSVTIEVRGSSRILGNVDLGHYSIELSEVRRIHVLR
jgi:hypothetical protein